MATISVHNPPLGMKIRMQMTSVIRNYYSNQPLLDVMLVKVKPPCRRGKRLEFSHPCIFLSRTAQQHRWGSKMPFESLWIVGRDDGSRESERHHGGRRRDHSLALKATERPRDPSKWNATSEAPEKQIGKLLPLPRSSLNLPNAVTLYQSPVHQNGRSGGFERMNYPETPDGTELWQVCSSACCAAVPAACCQHERLGWASSNKRTILMGKILTHAGHLVPLNFHRKPNSGLLQSRNSTNTSGLQMRACA